MNTIRNLAWSNNKKNKTRSLLIMITIFLSTVLLTVICTYAYGIIKLQRANASINYGSYYGICRAVTMEQLTEMERHSEFSKLGIMSSAGMIDHKADVSFIITDDNGRDMANLSSQLKEGTFPKAEQDIAAQQEFFESIGYEGAAIGDTVVLEYRRDLQQTYSKREFTISGILNTQKSEAGQISYTVYASTAFYEAQFEPQERRYSVMFRLADSVEAAYDHVEEVVSEIMERCGIDKKYVSLNSAYLMWALDPGTETIAVSAVIALIVIILSVIVIYNIFHVGIAQNIREYGKIRALGATKKQMRRLIYLEGLMLAAYSIPAGTAAGYAAAWGSFEWLMQKSSQLNDGIERAHVSIFSMPVLLSASLLALFTVLLALRRPMKIAASVSPIDAVRYEEGIGSKKAGVRKGRPFVTVTSLAAANLSANRRRTVRTILAMGLSCVLFVVLANCVGNIDAEYEARKNVEHGQFLIGLDYSMNDKAYKENNLDSILKNNPLNKAFIAKIQEINGVTEVETRNILLLTVDGRQQTMSVLNEEDFNRKKQESKEAGELDYHASDSIYYGWMQFIEDEGYELGQQMTMEITNGTDESTVNSILKGSFGSMDTDWVMTQEMYEKLNLSDHASIGWLWVDCDKKDISTVRTQLEMLLSSMEHVEMEVFADIWKTSETSSFVLRLGCYLFLGIIGLVGFMNLANTTIINIITKKQEYGILQAVGMTNKQLNLSLQMQGMILTAGTVLTAVLAGLPAGYGLFIYCRNHAVFGINQYHVPVIEIACMAAAVALLQLGLSYLLSKNLKKESLVDRIRHQE